MKAECFAPHCPVSAEVKAEHKTLRISLSNFFNYFNCQAIRRPIKIFPHAQPAQHPETEARFPI